MTGSRPASFLSDSSSAFDKHQRKEEYAPIPSFTFTKLQTKVWDVFLKFTSRLNIKHILTKKCNFCKKECEKCEKIKKKRCEINVLQFNFVFCRNLWCSRRGHWFRCIFLFCYNATLTVSHIMALLWYDLMIYRLHRGFCVFQCNGMAFLLSHPARSLCQNWEKHIQFENRRESRSKL